MHAGDDKQHALEILTGTREEMEAVLKRKYVQTMEAIPADDLLRFHLTQLEIVVTHLTTMALGLPRLTTVEGNNLAVLARIHADRLDGLIWEHPGARKAGLAAFWASVSKLLASVCSSTHKEGHLGEGILIAHCAARMLLETWHEAAPQLEFSPPYCCKEEEDFIAALRFPILQSMPIVSRTDVLMRNIDSWLKLKA